MSKENKSTNCGLIIGVGYKSNSGKGVVTEYLCNSYDFEELAFAYHLKQSTMMILGSEYESCFTQKGKASQIESDPLFGFDTYDLTYGEFLQKFGQFVRDEVCPNFWVDHLFNQQLPKVKNKNVVISDLRHPNEADSVKKAGGFNVLIKRDNKEMLEGRDPHHISEVALDDYDGWDFVIENNSTLSALYTEVDEMLTSIYNR